MDYVVTVQVPYSTYHLSEVKWCKIFLEIIFFSDFFEQASISDKF